MKTHGVRSTYRVCKDGENGKACPACQLANMLSQRESTASRSARLAADPTIRPHGDINTYKNWGCRCEPCREAEYEHTRAKNSRLLGRPVARLGPRRHRARS